MVMEKELFELLHEASKSNYSEYLYNVWSTMALTVGAIGWLLTSDSARGFLGRNREARYVSMLFVTTIAMIHFLVLFHTQQQSQEILSLLMDDRYVVSNEIPEAYFNQYFIPWIWPVTSSVLNGLLFSLLIFFIYKTPKFSRSE